jgi:limonene-1,2-epoxide hydrolase
MAGRYEQIAIDFMDCWRRFDLEDAVSRISEDCVFTPDIKAEPVVGRAAIRALWAKYMESMKTYSMEVRSVLASDRLVYLERVERVLGSVNGEMALPIVGVYELDAEGKITAWRDYWDTSMVSSH